jgi:hypothetical protein
MYVEQLSSRQDGSEAAAAAGGPHRPARGLPPASVRIVLQALAVLATAAEPVLLTKILPAVEVEPILEDSSAGEVRRSGALVSTAHPIHEIVLRARRRRRRDLHVRPLCWESGRALEVRRTAYTPASPSPAPAARAVAERAWERGDLPSEVLSLRRGLDQRGASGARRARRPLAGDADLRAQAGARRCPLRRPR